MVYRGPADAGAPGRQRFVYIPRPRTWRAWVVDLMVLVSVVTVIAMVAHRDVVTCRWANARASCDLAEETALGNVTHRTFGGIHSAAYRVGTRVGFVTDTNNRDANALFATRELVLADEASAEKVEAFANDRDPDVVSVTGGASHPLAYTLGLLAILLTYTLVTRSPAYSLVIDRGERLLFLRKGRNVERFELATVEGMDVENKAAGLHRVRLRLAGAKPRPLTPDFYPGGHHHDFAAEVSSALAPQDAGG